MVILIVVVLVIIVAFLAFTSSVDPAKLREETEAELAAVKRRRQAEDADAEREVMQQMARKGHIPILFNAASHGDWSLLSLGLEHGFDVNTREEDGWTLLHAAAREGRTEVIERLLGLGANPLTRTNDGATAADFAETNGHRDLAARLRSLQER